MGEDQASPEFTAKLEESFGGSEEEQGKKTA